MTSSLPTDRKPPPPVVTAVRLMYIGGALAFVGAVLWVFTADWDNGLSRAVGMAGIISDLVAVGLWIWMASANGRGYPWARIVAAVFFVGNTIGTIWMLVDQTATTPAHLVIRILGWLVGGAAIFFLFRPESTAFYTGHE